MEKLFDKVGFIKEYRDEYSEFYKPFFQSEEELKDFFFRVFQNDDIDKTPRRMMNQIQRFVSLPMILIVLDRGGILCALCL